MSPSPGRISVTPELCDQCGACRSVCPNGSVMVGQNYVIVDWSTCDNCGKCVEVCGPAALSRATVSPRAAKVATAPVAPTEVGKVVVGSRAEAKAVRKAAEQAAKQTSRANARPTYQRRPAANATTAAAQAPSAAPVAELVDAAPMTSTTEAARPPANVTPFPTHAVRGEGAEGVVRWGWVDTFAVLAVLVVTIVGKNAILALPALALMPTSGLAVVRALTLSAYYAIQISAFVLLAGRHGAGLLAAFGLTRASDDAAAEPRGSLLVTAGLIVALLVGVEIVALGYGMAAEALGWHQSAALSSDVSTVFGGGGLGLVLSAVLVALIAPFAEELAFRGVILASVDRQWGTWPAIVISAVLFAAYHVNLWLFFPMVVFGIALGWLSTSRRSLWPAIILHVLYNALAVAAAFFVK